MNITTNSFNPHSAVVNFINVAIASPKTAIRIVPFDEFIKEYSPKDVLLSADIAKLIGDAMPPCT